jgi:hypothetical protein
MLPTGVIVIRNKNNVCTAQKFGVLWLPFTRASCIAGCGNIPRQK